MEMSNLHFFCSLDGEATPPLYFYMCITQYHSLCYHDEYDQSPIPTVLAIPRVVSFLVFCQRVQIALAHILPACYQPLYYFTLIYVYLLFCCLYNRSCPVRQVIEIFLST